MKWNKFTIKTTGCAEELISAALFEVGINAVEIEDSRQPDETETQTMFGDIPPEPCYDDGTAYIHFYLKADEDSAELLRIVEKKLDELKAFADIGEGIISVSGTEDSDWINNWKKYFRPFSVGEFRIVPSWEDIKEDDKDGILLRIDPGTAFGTGLHETTQLCLEQLGKYVNEGSEILDIGTGSGILGIAALKKGAKRVFATDLDPCTLNAVKDNLNKNSVSEESFSLTLGNIIDDKSVQDKAGYELYDLAFANILADVLIKAAPQIIKHLKPEGVFISSGILDIKENDVVKAMKAAGFTIEEIKRKNEWVSVTGRKTGTERDV